MPCFITQTGSFLPGPPIENERIEEYLGSLEGESDVKRQVLAMNGISQRHYAQDKSQTPTMDVYQLACAAVEDCLINNTENTPVTFLSAGTTYAPLSGPGIGSILHERLKNANRLTHPVEISSHSGVCTSAAAAMVNAVRAVASGEHSVAICTGAEQASEVLKSTSIQPIDDRGLHSDVRRSQWFMSVFLRFMLSDGAGAFLLRSSPNASGLSLRVDWTHSLSFANETPLCMKLENRSQLLSQDVAILSRYLFPSARKFVNDAFQRHSETIHSYSLVLPHLSSFFFRRKFEGMLKELSNDPLKTVRYWTNLATAGNTGAASIYIMLDQYLKENTIRDGERMLLFIPESGQFNFVLVSLTAVVR